MRSWISPTCEPLEAEAIEGPMTLIDSPSVMDRAELKRAAW
jgi:hypothetical protein